MNIVLIVADDLGFSDIGAYGGEIHTPALDALARSGVRFSNFYNTARCSPSRASLLTGMHPHQTGIGVLTRPDLPEGYAGDLSPACETLAERFARAGWETWMSGKWHLSAQTRTPSPSWPTRRGFQKFFGTIRGCSSYFEPQSLFHGEDEATDAYDDPDFYYTDAISDNAASWIRGRDRGADATPFFLYVAFTAPHWPLHARDEDIATYEHAYDEGWDALRAQRLRRQLDEGILPPNSELSDRDPTQPAWDDVQDKAWQASRMAVYAAQVDRMDQGIARIVAALKETDAFDDTMVVFLSDNGGSAEELPIGDWESFRRKDVVLKRGTTRSGEEIRVGNLPSVTPGGEATYSSYGVPWANLSNTPFRRYKRWVHEGGISSPLIVHWPGGDLTPGAIVSTPCQLVDVMPTLMESAGVRDADAPAEGRSLLPALRGETVSDVPLFWEHVGNAAMRDGRWKLVRAFPGRWELYDLQEDPDELVDLFLTEQRRAREMADRWQRWADRVGVIPWYDMVDRGVRAGFPAANSEE